MVVGELGHGSISEEAHVLAKQECEVTSLNLLVVDNSTALLLVADLLDHPLRILCVSQHVILTGVHSSRDLNLAERELSGYASAPDPRAVVLIEDLEAITVLNLSVVKQVLD